MRCNRATLHVATAKCSRHMQPKRRLKRNVDPELLLVRTVRATDTQWAAIKRVTWARLRSLAMEMDAQMQREAKREAASKRAPSAPARPEEPAVPDEDLLAAAKERFRRAAMGGP